MSKEAKKIQRTCVDEKCGGACLKKHTVVKGAITGLDTFAVEVEYYVCLKCGQEFQTELQQMLFMKKVLEKIPEESIQLEDKAMLHSINVMLGEEESVQNKE